MPVCKGGTLGGKGNRGKILERVPQICPAGLPSAQPEECVADTLRHYLLQEEVDALVSDAIVPPPPPHPLLPIRKPIARDVRNTSYGEVADLVNPPGKTKFQDLINDFKDTIYKSYWKNPLGKSPDSTPMFPKGFDQKGTTYGRKLPDRERLYDIIFPINPVTSQTHFSTSPARHSNREYCQPAFSKDVTYGHRSHIDKRGIYIKSCLTDQRVLLGKSLYTPIYSLHADYIQKNTPVIGKSSAPNNVINYLPEGHTFGRAKYIEAINIEECVMNCEINPEIKKFRKCLVHLNTLRDIISTRHSPSFFNKMYLFFKYSDKEKTDWLPKNDVYNYCISQYIRIDPELIEPLLSALQAFNENNIKYGMFCHILNNTKYLPTFPKIQDVPQECLDFRTTYGEMVKPCHERDERLRAGVPSGRYIDKNYPVIPSDQQCEAHKICLAQEIDAKACIYPSIFSAMHINHRDLYAKREPHVVKRVFEAAGEKFTDEKFNKVWEAAKKYHSQGWVCYETFRKALEELSSLPKI